MNVCAKFGDPSSILCQVIIRTSFGIPTDMSRAIYPHFVEGGHNNAELTMYAHTKKENIVKTTVCVIRCSAAVSRSMLYFDIHNVYIDLDNLPTTVSTFKSVTYNSVTC